MSLTGALWRPPLEPMLLGPGGLFLPTQVPDLKLWLDVFDLSTLFQDSALTTPVTANSDPLGGWKDKSGNGNHVVQATASKRPLYKTNIVNGKSMVLFDQAASQCLSITSLPAALQVDNWTYFVVVKNATTGALIHLGDAGVAHQTLRTNNGAPNKAQIQSNTASGNDSPTGTSDISSGTFVIMGRRSVAEGRVDVAVNNVIEGSDTSLTATTAAYGTSKRLDIGAQLGGTQRPYAGYISGALIYTRDLSVAEYTALARSLGSPVSAAVA